MTEGSTRTCPDCLNRLSADDDLFCWFCGARQAPAIEVVPDAVIGEPRRTVATRSTSRPVSKNGQLRTYVVPVLVAVGLLVLVVASAALYGRSRNEPTRSAMARPSATVSFRVESTRPPTRTPPTATPRRPTATPTRAPTRLPDPTRAPTARAAPTSRVAVVVAAGGARLRSQPVRGAPVAYAADAGTRLVVLSGPVASDGLTWYEIKMLEGPSAWVKSDAIRIGS